MPNDNTTAQTKVDDKKFVKDATVSVLTEVELGKLAAQKATNDSLKQFGQSTVDEQTKLGNELKQVARQANVDIPDSIDSKHQSRIEKLSNLSGAEFDRVKSKRTTRSKEKH